MDVTNPFPKIIDHFVYSKIRQFETIEGFLTRADAVCLYRTARKLRLGSSIVEIGSWQGKSTYCLARGLRGGRVVAIDPFDASGEAGSAEHYAQARNADLHETFCRAMSSLGVAEKIDVRKGTSRDFVGQIGDIDLLFIDGDHSIEACRFDYEHYATHVKKGGYVLFHDYQPWRPDFGPTWVIEKLVIPSKLWQPMGIAGSIWTGRRI